MRARPPIRPARAASAASPGTSTLRRAQRAAPFGRRVLPWLPETASRAVLAAALRRWPSLWGMLDGGKRMQAARRAHCLAFPGCDAERFAERWVAMRGEDLAASLVYMARTQAGRRSRLVEASRTVELSGERPTIVALLHYSIDPALTLAILEANPRRSFRWPLYPMQPGVEDDRAIWFAGLEVPDRIERTLLWIDEAGWLLRALSHLRRGGDLFVEIDTPFDSRRSSAVSMRIGDLAMPIATSVEFLLDKVDAQLLFVSPQRRGRTWIAQGERVEDVTALAAAATAWIDRNPWGWAGWPLLRWREPSVSMRRNVSRRIQ